MKAYKLLNNMSDFDNYIISIMGDLIHVSYNLKKQRLLEDDGFRRLSLKERLDLCDILKKHNVNKNHK